MMAHYYFYSHVLSYRLEVISMKRDKSIETRPLLLQSLFYLNEVING